MVTKKLYGVMMTEETEYYYEVWAKSEEDAGSRALCALDSGRADAVGSSNPEITDIEEEEP